jgi:hypothetical protein
MASNLRKKVSQSIGFAVALVTVAVFMAAAVLPVFLLFRYLQNLYRSHKLREEFKTSGSGIWLSKEEREDFIRNHTDQESRISRNRDEFETVERLIKAEHQKASEGSIATNKDGSYSRRSYLGAEIQAKIEELNVFTAVPQNGLA